jgi:transposase
MVAGTEGSHHKEGSRKMGQHTIVCAGIDTGKRKLDVAIEGRQDQLQVSNTVDGHRALSTWLRQHRVKRIGIEASGGYEQDVVLQLRGDGFVVIVFQPAQVRAYAKFHRQLAKNDKLDAALIAACTAATRTIHAPPDPRLSPLAQHLTFIEQIIADIAQTKTRRESCRDARIRQHWDAEIARLKRLRRAEFEALVAAIRQHRDFAEQLALSVSVEGVGLATAVGILVRMPEIGRVTREEAAALAGLAPYDDDSGGHTGLRHIKDGRERLRGILYCAALPAVFRWNRQLGVLYRRLLAAGKPHKVALIACARKLLIYVNTVIARGTPWSKQPPSRISAAAQQRP